ncbi:MAG: T9SS type A sorting domain-containing protein [Flavobacteriales bacterium]|nr:T9SS type A sorting domain-containing protein [Flavobacteriales bacterium]
MKKLLLSLIAITSMSFAIAQNCAPNGAFTVPGVYPDSATGLAIATVGVPYSETITTITPVDTCVQVLPLPFPCTTVPIDSVVVDSISGLPPGFSIVSENENNLNFYFYGGTSSCMLVTGTAAPGDEGIYPIYVAGLSWAQLAGIPTSQPFIVDYYQIEIVSATGVEALTGKTFQVRQNIPNPFNNTSNIEFYLPQANNVSINIYNVLGKSISNEEIQAVKGTNSYSLNAADFSNGVYFYNLTYSNQTITKRFIVNK